MDNYTKKENELLQAYYDAPMGDDEKELFALRAVRNKNRKQRALRATEAGRAEAARAKRRSYWKKEQGYRHAAGDTLHCTICERLKREHDL